MLFDNVIEFPVSQALRERIEAAVQRGFEEAEREAEARAVRQREANARARAFAESYGLTLQLAYADVLTRNRARGFELVELQFRPQADGTLHVHFVFDDLNGRRIERTQTGLDFAEIMARYERCPVGMALH